MKQVRDFRFLNKKDLRLPKITKNLQENTTYIIEESIQQEQETKIEGSLKQLQDILVENDKIKQKLDEELYHINININQNPGLKIKNFNIDNLGFDPKYISKYKFHQKIQSSLLTLNKKQTKLFQS